MKKALLALLFSLTLVLAACGSGNNDKSEAPASESSAEESTAAAASEEGAEKIDPAVTLKIGVSPVPHQEIVEAAKENLAARGINLEIVPFDDYIQPNVALDAGDLDANYFQHQPYLDNFNKENKMNLVSIGTVHIEPIAAFSAKYKSLDELPDGAQVQIPNDVTNGARALLLLEKAGLIKLDDPSNINVTEANITENSKHLTFVPMEAAVIANTYKDSDLAVINANYALSAGLNPVKDSLAIEAEDSPYANVVAVRADQKDDPKFKILLEELNSETVKKFIEDKYQGAVIPAFSLKK